MSQSIFYAIFLVSIVFHCNHYVTAQQNRLPGPIPPFGPARFPNPAMMLGQNPANFGLANFGPFTRGNPNGFPGMGFNPAFGPGGFNPYAGFQQQQQEIFTAVGKDPLDPNSQMRLTITERRDGFSQQLNLFGERDYDTPTNWYVQGTFIGNQNLRPGSYYVVLTTGGRTSDGCGPSLQGNIVGIANAFNNPFQQFQSGMPSGVMPNRLLVGSGGPTMYSSTLDGVSRRQLAGAGIAACSSISNGACAGIIPFCATVSKDVLTAMELPVTPTSGFAPFAPGLLGGTTGVGTTGLTGGGGVGTTSGLFTSPLLANSKTPEQTSGSDLFS